MLNKKVLDEMNNQVQRELDSAYLYLSMAAYFETKSLPGFAQWMHIQFQEEQAHAFKFFHFINDRGEKVVLQALNAPTNDFKSPLDVFEQTLAHEEKVSAYINDIFALATAEKEFSSFPLLQWFIDEQVEEEKNAGEIVDTLKMIGDDNSALLMLDRELAQRTLPAEAQPGGGV